MARKLRVEYPEAVYQVMNRGDRREAIFRDDRDREIFLATLGEACGKTGWQVPAFWLMGDHFHLVVETPQGNLVAGMQWLLGTYTGRFHRRHKVFGHLFSGRYKALSVDGRGHGCRKTVCDYVHLNPVRAKLVRPGRPLAAYQWSSWPAYMEPPRRRWPWLRVDRVLGESGIARDRVAGRRQLATALEARRAGETGTDYQGLRRGWCLGDAACKRELLGRRAPRVGAEHYGAERAGSGVARAERIVAEELQRLGWQAGDLGRHAKGDAGKVAAAVRLRAETVMPVKWIAERLHMGAPGYVNRLLYLHRKEI